MRDVIQFAILGLGAGAIYALVAQGIVLIYRASGVLNFAQGAMAMVGAFVFYDFTNRHGWSNPEGFIAAVAISAVLGAMVYLFVMRPLRRASPLARVIATLAVLVILQSAAIIRYTASPFFVPSWLPSSSVTLPGDISVGRDRLLLAAIVTASTCVLALLSRRTKVGLATSAVAENPRSAAAVGWSPDVLGVVNWSLGTALAGAAGILIIPIIGLKVSTVTWIVVPAMAAALVGGFSSFGLTLAAALGIGILQSEITRYVDTPGAPTALPLAVIIAVLVIRGQSLPLRSHLLERLPELGTGRFRLRTVVPAVALAAAAMVIFPDNWVSALTVSCIAAILFLSIVVLTGYAGQLSLAQFALAGIGALVAAHMVTDHDLPFEAAIVIGVAAAVVFGVVLSLPALRARGVNLAIVTLGIGVATLEVVFNVQKYSGDFNTGLRVGNQTFFGVHLDAALHPTPYALLTLGFLVASAWLVCNIRRGAAGRRLIAVRTNERAAAALGISVFRAKIYAFAVSAGLAGLSGILLGFTNRSIYFAQIFDPVASINAVVLTVVGGVGFVIGPLFASTLANGGFPGGIVAQHFDSGAQWLALIGGVLLILLLLQDPHGMARANVQMLETVKRKLLRSEPKPVNVAALLGTKDDQEQPCVVPSTLEVRGLTVRFGGVVAVQDVSLTMRTGEVVGLIGPNGAGKSTVIDAVTGFVKPSAGEVLLGGKRLDGLAPHRRARAGVTRSFQSLELFDDVSVLDNIRAASDPGDDVAYLTSLVRPVNRPLSAAAVAAIRTFRLEDDLLRRPEELPYGRRRLVAIARAAATSPSFLLLDEPAAGMGDMESAEVGQLIRFLAEEWGIGVLVIEHDVSLVMSSCDRIAVLDFGRKIAEGAPDEIRANELVVAAYLGVSDGEVLADANDPAVAVLEAHPSPARGGS